MATTSPFAFVCVIAAAKLRYGMSTEHGLVSRPLWETKVPWRVAEAGLARRITTTTRRTWRMASPSFSKPDAPCVNFVGVEWRLWLESPRLNAFALDDRQLGKELDHLPSIAVRLRVRLAQHLDLRLILRR